MTDLLIRNVPADALATLKARAKRNGRSLQAEALALIESGTRKSGDEFVQELRRLRASGNWSFDLSVALDAIRSDRDR